MGFDHFSHSLRVPPLVAPWCGKSLDRCQLPRSGRIAIATPPGGSVIFVGRRMLS